MRATVGFAFALATATKLASSNRKGHSRAGSDTESTAAVGGSWLFAGLCAPDACPGVAKKIHISCKPGPGFR